MRSSSTWGEPAANNGKNAKNGNYASHASHSSHSSSSYSHSSHSPSDRLLPPRGDYQTLLSFQKAEVVYDITFRFAHKFLSRADRTIDQMIQAARSGKQNILEGSKAGLTSKETEIKLTNVARASLEELLADYRDFLRVRDLPVWSKDSKEALFVRHLGRNAPATYESYREFVDTRPAKVVANIAICLIHQTNYLIDQQLRRLESDFLRQGGLRERMTRARLSSRGGTRPAGMIMANTRSTWPFDQPPDAAAITLRRIVLPQEGCKPMPILLVTHDKEDHGWQFLDGDAMSSEDAAVVGSGTMLDHDPTLREVADLPPGWTATRTKPGARWRRTPT